MARRGPKSWTSKRTKPSYARPARSTSYRKATTRPAEGLKKMVQGVRGAGAVHRFTRWGPTQTLVNNVGTAGSFSIMSDIGQKNVTIGSIAADSSGIANTWMLGGSMQWTLADLPGVADFTSLYDHYEIEQIDVEINCLKNSAQSESTLPELMPTILWVPDFDDGGVPGAAGDISQYQRAKTWTFRGSGSPLKFSIKPRVSIPVFRTAVTSAYSVGAASTTLDLAYTDVPHYGCKFWLDKLSSDGLAAVNGQTALTFRMKYHLKFSDPK